MSEENLGSVGVTLPTLSEARFFCTEDSPFVQSLGWNRLWKGERERWADILVNSLKMSLYLASPTNLPSNSYWDSCEWRTLCLYLLPNMRLHALPKLKDPDAAQYCAVCVESRELEHTEFVLRKTSRHLTSDWGMMVVCTEDNWEYMKGVVEEINIGIKLVKWSGAIRSVADYNELMLNPKFWDLIHSERVLFFQEDGFLLRDGIEDFLSWDYIGAPWPLSFNMPKPGIGNGGFSLRNVALSKEALRAIPMASVQRLEERTLIQEVLPEDAYFSRAIPLVSPQARIPTRRVAREFSCEGLAYSGSLGFHCWQSIKNYKAMLVNSVNPLTIRITNLKNYPMQDSENFRKFLTESNFCSMTGSFTINCDEFLESEYLWDKPKNYDKTKPWAGFVHLPVNVAPYANENNLRHILTHRYAENDFDACLGLITFSEHNRRQLEDIFSLYETPPKIYSIPYPAARKPSNKFCWGNYNKKIIQIGSRNLKLSLFYQMFTVKEKIWLSEFNEESSLALAVADFESENAQIISLDKVKILAFSLKIYEEMLSSSLVFLPFYDLNYSKVLIDGLSCCTPMLVRDHPAAREYLGDEYPLFFTTVAECERLLTDKWVKLGHEYLCDAQELRDRLSPKNVAKSLFNIPLGKTLHG